MEFQSTLPTRGSDCDKKAGGDRPMNFNPRSPRGGATLNVGDKLICKAISIHAPHEGERRVRAAHSDSIRQDFNPRSPRGGATFNSAIRQRMWVISIHAPHEGERRSVCMVCVHVVDFNPRSPRGGATNAPNRGYARVAISIHAPHEGERGLKYRLPLAFRLCLASLPLVGSVD